jgi:protein TonB
MTQAKRKNPGMFKAMVHRLLVAGGAVVLTMAFFLVLPLMQTLAKPADTGTVLTRFDTTELEPPPPPPEPEPEEPDPEDEEPPELEPDEAPPVSLSEIEVALGSNIGEGWLRGDFAATLSNIATKAEEDGGVYDIADLDQKPRVVYQPNPMVNSAIRRKAPGKVFIIFIVDEEGRVVKPKIQKSSDSVFEQASLSAVKQWKFEPGKRNGKPVRFRIRVPITFPEGL